MHLTCIIVPCYPRIPVICLFPVTNIVMHITGYCYSCYWYGYFRYWTWELLICDMWESHIYCSRFPLYCSCFPLYCSMLSTELKSSYHVTRIMYCIGSRYIVYLTYQIIKLTGYGETWRLTRSCRVDVWIHCLSHCMGRGSAGYRLLLMSSRFPLLF